MLVSRETLKADSAVETVEVVGAVVEAVPSRVVVVVVVVVVVAAAAAAAAAAVAFAKFSVVAGD